MVKQSSVSSVGDYVKVKTAIGPPRKGFVPKSYLVEADSPEALEGYANFSRAEAELHCKPSMFILRPTSQTSGQHFLAVTFKLNDKEVNHFLIRRCADGRSLSLNNQRFKNAEDIVNKFKQVNMKPFKVILINVKRIEIF